MLLKTDSKDSISSILEKYPIENINVIGRMKNADEWSLYVDGLKNATQFVFNAINGDEDWYAVFSQDPGNLKTMLRNFKFPDTVGFCGLPMDIADKVIDALYDYEVEWKEHCCLYYIPEEKYDYFKNLDVSLDSLKEADLNIVNDYYTYKDEGSYLYLKTCIEKNPSSVIRDESGSPISWAMMREDGSLGVMYTLKEHRKKGHALTISNDLIKKVINYGFQPYAHIIVENTPSRSMSEKAGFVHWGDVLWFGMKK